MEKLYVYLRFVDDEITAEEITKILGVEPTRSRKKGDLIPSKNRP